MLLQSPTGMFHWIRQGLSTLLNVLVLPSKLPLAITGNPTTAFLIIRATVPNLSKATKKSSVSLHDLQGLFFLAFTISQLTHPTSNIHSPLFYCTLQGAKNKGGSVYSVCPLPSSAESLPSTSPTITPKHHTEGGCLLRLRGIVGWEVRGNGETGMEGREGDSSHSVDFAC